jgi:hypothetical protein
MTKIKIVSPKIPPRRIHASGIVGKRERCVERLGNLVQLVPETYK